MKAPWQERQQELKDRHEAIMTDRKILQSRRSSIGLKLRPTLIPPPKEDIASPILGILTERSYRDRELSGGKTLTALNVYADRCNNRLFGIYLVNNARFSNNYVEKAMLYIVLRTPFVKYDITRGRYRFDFTEMNTEFIAQIVQYILTCKLERINYSWVAPLQDLILFPKEEKKKKVPFKSTPPRGNQIRKNPGLQFKASAQSMPEYFDDPFESPPSVIGLDIVDPLEGGPSGPTQAVNAAQNVRNIWYTNSYVGEGSSISSFNNIYGKGIMSSLEEMIKKETEKEVKQQTDEWMSEKEMAQSSPSTSVKSPQDSKDLGF